MPKKASKEGKDKPVIDQPQGLKMLPIDHLLLDSKNPRLPEGYEESSPEQIIKVMARDYKLIEIGQSLMDNGYFPQDPLVAIPDKAGKYTVVEGNRRLAALKLLLDSSLAAGLSLRRWVDLSNEMTQKIKQGTAQRIEQVPVVIYQKREQVVPFLGFRHISGILKWDAYAKARFLSRIVADGKSFRDVGRETGSNSPTVRKHVIGYQVLVQAEEKLDVDVSRAKENFGKFYRALNSPGIRGFIALNIELSEDKVVDPVPADKAKEVSELFVWMFGDESNKPAMRESRHITELGEVLENKEAIEALRTSGDLDYAFSLTGGEKKRLIENLKKAGFYLDQGLTDVHRHTDNKDVERCVNRCAKSVQRYLDVFPNLTGNGK